MRAIRIWVFGQATSAIPADSNQFRLTNPSGYQAEYANKAATLELVDRNSRLGWEPSMDYMGGRAMIEWSMKLMRDAYGLDMP